MFGIQELKQVKTKDKPAIVKMVWVLWLFYPWLFSLSSKGPALPRTAFTEHVGRTILERGKRFDMHFLHTQIYNQSFSLLPKSLGSPCLEWLEGIPLSGVWHSSHCGYSTISATAAFYISVWTAQQRREITAKTEKFKARSGTSNNPLVSNCQERKPPEPRHCAKLCLHNPETPPALKLNLSPGFRIFIALWTARSDSVYKLTVPSQDCLC